LDPKALNHVLINTQDYHKPESTRFNLGRIIGPGESHVVMYHKDYPDGRYTGVLVVEGRILPFIYVTMLIHPGKVKNTNNRYVKCCLLSIII
jgi:hypothetical protein